MIKTKNLLLKNIQNPNIFFDILLSIPKDIYLEKILLLLKKEKELDFFLLATQAIKNDYEVFKLQLILDKLVFVSILKTETILELYKTLSHLHYDYISLNITEKIAKESPTFSLELYVLMKKNCEEFMTSPLNILFISLYENNKAYERMQELFQNKNIFILQSAIEISALIKLLPRETEEVYEIFLKLMEIKNINVDKTILFSSNKIKEKDGNFENILELYAKDERLEIKYSLSKILLLNKCKDVEKLWFRTCLFSLSSINKYDKEILRNISFILNNIINEKQDYEIIIEFLKEGIKAAQIQNNFPKKDFTLFIKNFSQNHPTLFNEFKKDIKTNMDIDLIKILSYFQNDKRE